MPAAPDLADVLRGDAAAWRRFVAYYEPPTASARPGRRGSVPSCSRMPMSTMSSVTSGWRWCRTKCGCCARSSPSAVRDLLTWLALHVSHVAHEQLQRKGEEPTFVPFDETRHGAAPAATTVDEAIRAAVRDAISRELRNARRQSRRRPRRARSEYVSPARAAEIAGVRPATIREWVSRGRLPSHRAGRLMRIRTDDLHRFLAAWPRAEKCRRHRVASTAGVGSAQVACVVGAGGVIRHV